VGMRKNSSEEPGEPFRRMERGKVKEGGKNLINGQRIMWGGDDGRLMKEGETERGKLSGEGGSKGVQIQKTSKRLILRGGEREEKKS